jgi:hypothetical protein
MSALRRTPKDIALPTFAHLFGKCRGLDKEPYLEHAVMTEEENSVARGSD